MSERIQLGLVMAAAVASGLVAGIFYAFSSFVMAGLARLPAADGAAAMNAINVAVITPSFLLLFVGSVLLTLAPAAMALAGWGPLPATPLVAAALLHLLGCFAVTLLFNVPLNDRLAAAGGESAAFWPQYLPQWLVWNHVRTLAPLAALGLYLYALLAYRAS